MPKTLHNQLTTKKVESLTEPGLYADGGGLYLRVAYATPQRADSKSWANAGTKAWVFRYRFAGKARTMGLGPAGPGGVSLKDARLTAEAARGLLRADKDPMAERDADRARRKAEAAAQITFQRCAELYIAGKADEWKNAKHGDQWRNTLAQHAHPIIGEKPVGSITKEDILAVLRQPAKGRDGKPIANSQFWTETTETANRVRNRIELVLDWAAVHGHRSGDNPARWRGYLDKVLPKPKKVAPVEHHPALPPKRVPAFMEQLRAKGGTGARALEFTILCAVRSGETRGATWGEFDLDERVWLIPAARMKASKPHRVPLTDAALAILQSLPRGSATDLVFKAPRGGALSDMTLAKVIRDMNEVPKGQPIPWVDPDGKAVVPHGFRSSFRDWAGEETKHPREVVEHALAHRLGDAAEQAYARGDLFEKRIALMRDWAAWCAGGE